MKFKSLGYCIGQGFKNIGRNRIFSLASIATMALCIFILGLFFSVSSNVKYMVEQMSETLCVKVFFDKGISDERIQSIGNSIKEYDGVTTIHYTSKEEAWENYKQEYFGEEYMYIADGFKDNNPLSDSASYEVYFKDAEMQDELVKYINTIDGVRRVNSSEVTADSLSEISSLVGLISIVMFLILLAIALFLINNTIAIGISVRKEEIYVMKLLGARNAFIRAPFIVEGVVIGIFGAVIPLALMYIGYDSIVSYVLTKFSFLANVLVFMPVGQIMLAFVPVALILGLGLGLIGSLISVGRHLNV